MFAKIIKFQLFTRGPLMLVYNHNGTLPPISHVWVLEGSIYLHFTNNNLKD